MKIIHLSPSSNEVVVRNLDEDQVQVLDLHASKLVAKPAFKIGEVAKILGKKADTIRKWEARGWTPPQKKWNIGGSKEVRFYSADDVESMRDVAQYIHVGRPRKDKRITNAIPDRGNLKRYLRDRMRNFDV